MEGEQIQDALDELFTVDYDFSPDELAAFATLRLVTKKPKKYTFKWRELRHLPGDKYSVLVESNLVDPRVISTWFKPTGATIYDTRCAHGVGGPYLVIFAPGRNDDLKGEDDVQAV